MNNFTKFTNAGLAVMRLGRAVPAIPHRIGEAFTARHFSEEMFAGSMDPLLMVDDFVMTGPTFAPHLHAGISAVTMMLEDAEGDFINRDTLGHRLALKAGDLYWLATASGAAHEETPAPGARVHALQVFVNLPARLKSEPARAILVRAADVPMIEGAGFRVRVLLGRSGGVTGAVGTPEEMTILDGMLDPGGHFAHELPEDRSAWIYAISGAVTVSINDEERVVDAGNATTIEAGRAAELSVRADAQAHFVAMAARPIRESFVKAGPLVMATAEDVRSTLDCYASGSLGRIPA